MALSNCHIGPAANGSQARAGIDACAQRIFPPAERIAEPGSTSGTAVGVFLSYASPVFLTVAFVPLFDGDIVVGLAVGAFAVASWMFGHWFVGR
ncbi:MAG: hypothetical protein ACXW1Y_04710 [Acidimicrobiia bacterium]